MAKSESGAQLLARIGHRPTVDGLEEALFGTDGPKTGDIYEVYGEEGVGKTELLLHVAAKAIFPKTWKSLELSGFGAKVVYVDTDYKFNISRLAAILRLKVRHSTVTINGISQNLWDKLSSDERECLIKDSLENIKLMRCSSSEELLCCLHSIENLLCEFPDITIIMLDSVSAFYWIDRCNNMLDNNIAHVKKILNRLVTEYQLILFVTKAAIVRKKARATARGGNLISRATLELDGSVHEGTFGYAEFLGTVWHAFIQNRIILQRDISKNPNLFSVYCKQLNLMRNFHIVDEGLKFT